MLDRPHAAIARGTAIHMMIADGLPACCIIDPATRRASWKGRKLTRQGSAFKPDPRHEEPATRALRELVEKLERAKKDQRNADQREARLMKKRQNARLTKERKAAREAKAAKQGRKPTEPQVVSRLKAKPHGAASSPLKRPIPQRAAAPAPAKAPRPAKATKAARKPAHATAPAKPGEKPLKGNTAKLAQMLRGSRETTLAAVCEAFGWQAHSARSAISVLAKRLGVDVAKGKNAKGEATYALPAA